MPRTAAILARLGPPMAGALCCGRAPFWDDTVPGEDAEGRQVRLAAALTLCTGCPVRRRCRSAADSERAPQGIWGGVLLDPAIAAARERDARARTRRADAPC